MEDNNAILDIDTPDIMRWNKRYNPARWYYSPFKPRNAPLNAIGNIMSNKYFRAGGLLGMTAFDLAKSYYTRDNAYMNDFSDWMEDKLYDSYENKMRYVE